MWFNVGPGDRSIRLAAGLVMIWLYLGSVLVGPLGLFLAFVGFAALVTGITGACPLYRMLGIDTSGTPRPHRRAPRTAAGARRG